MKSQRIRHNYLRALQYTLESLEQRVLLTTAVPVNASTADQAVSSVGGLNFVGNTTERIGDNGTNASELALVIPFQLPMGTTVTAASFQIVLQSVGNQSSVTGNVDLYGLDYRPLSNVLTSDYFEGAYNTDTTDAVPIENAIFTHTSTPGTYVTTAAANTALANYLTAQYANGAGAGGYVFLRLNAESDQLTSRYWVVATGDNTGANQKPLLTITYNSILPPADTTPPVITLTSPAPSAFISGTAATFSGVAGTASGDSTNVTLNVYAGLTATGAPVQTLTATANAATGAYTLTATGLPQGQYTVQAVQSDNAGNIGTSISASYITYNTLPGDANNDSTVNFADFVILSNNFGVTNTNAGPSVGDFNFDKTVNFADFVILSNAFGQTFVAAPSNVTLHTTSSSSFHLAWQDNSNNETGFTIERSSDGTNFTAIFTTAANVSTYDDSIGLSPNTVYYYRIKAIDGANNSNYTAVASNQTIPAFLHTLWVDASSLVTATGSYTAPYTSIATAMAKAVPGDGVVVRAGTYLGRQNFGLSGTPTAPITLMGTPGERVILSGFLAVTGWTQYSGNIYVATSATAPVNLYTGMKELQQARGPDVGWNVWQSETTSGTTTVITDTAHLIGAPNLAGGTLLIHESVSNTYAYPLIISNDPVAGTVTIAADTSLAPTDIYMLKNKLTLVDAPGEWASEKQSDGTYKVYYWVNNTSELANMQMTSPTLTSLVTATSGVHDIVLSGFEIAGTKQYGVDIEHATDVVVSNNIVHDNLGTGIWLRYDTSVTIANNIALLNSAGIAIGSVEHALITQNEVEYNSMDGVDLTGDVSGKNPGDAGFVPSDDITFSYNYVHDQRFGTGGHPDDVQLYRWVTSVHITNNLLMDGGQGIMSEQVDDVAVPGTSTLTGNVIWGSDADLVIFGHNNSNNWTVSNNTLGAPGYALFSLTGFGYTFTENVFLGVLNEASYTGNRNLFWTTDPAGVIVQSPTFTNYTTIPAWNAASGQDANSVKANPMFNNVPMMMSVASVGSTASSFNLRSAVGWTVGNHVEIADDGIVRTITAISGNTITLNVPLAGPPLFDVPIYNWGSNTNFQWDTRLGASSPGNTMSATGGPVGSLINIAQYKNDDFNSDGKRDTPTLPADVVIPDLTWWPA